MLYLALKILTSKTSINSDEKYNKIYLQLGFPSVY